MANESPGGAELEHLLAQLLRMVSPACAGVRARTRGPARLTAALPVVSASEARALIELVSARGIAQGELAGVLGLDKSTVSRLAAGLERKGWIRRGRDEENQRYVRLYLTPQGGELWPDGSGRPGSRARPGSWRRCRPMNAPGCPLAWAGLSASWQPRVCW